MLASCLVFIVIAALGGASGTRPAAPVPIMSQAGALLAGWRRPARWWCAVVVFLSLIAERPNVFSLRVLCALAFRSLQAIPLQVSFGTFVTAPPARTLMWAFPSTCPEFEVSLPSLPCFFFCSSLPTCRVGDHHLFFPPFCSTRDHGRGGGAGAHQPLFLPAVAAGRPH